MASTTLTASSRDAASAEHAREYVKQHPGSTSKLLRVRRDEQALSGDSQAHFIPRCLFLVGLVAGSMGPDVGARRVAGASLFNSRLPAW